MRAVTHRTRINRARAARALTKRWRVLMRTIRLRRLPGELVISGRLLDQLDRLYCKRRGVEWP